MNGKERLEDIADFIRESYSMHGVEIGAQGARSITVRLPEDLPLTALCADLWNNFEAPVDLKPGPVLTVWGSGQNKIGTKAASNATARDEAGSGRFVWVCSILVLWICSAVASTIVGPYVLQTDVYKWATAAFNV